MEQHELQLAEAVRRAVVEALLEAYEDAGMSGLCGEGRFEVAVDAARSLDLGPTIEAFDLTRSRPTGET